VIEGGKLAGSTPAPVARFRRLFARERDVPLPGDRAAVYAYAYVLPGVAIYGLFVLIPIGQTLWISLHNWDGVSHATWAGLDNYREVFSDPVIRSAFEHAFVLVFFFSILSVAFALFITTLLSRSKIRGQAFFRTALFLPLVIATVAVGVIWRWIYAYDGPLNHALRIVGLGDLAHSWLADFTWALPSVGLVGTWVETGLCVVLFAAGVQKIPTSYYDAARVDGAGPLREFFAVTLPGLRNELVVAVSITTIAAFRSFDLVYIATRGGPGYQTTVPALEIYNRAFVYGQVGTASAIAAILAVLMIIVVSAIAWVGGRA
jgi:raffinose/stachyose/melibiose transport system permease protein